MSIPTTLLLPTVFWTGSGAARNHPAYGGSRSIRTTGHGVAIRRLSAWLWNRMVRKVRLELTRPLGHHGLDMTRLPVPSHAHMVGRAGFEPAVFPMSRFYRPLASASLHTDPYWLQGRESNPPRAAYEAVALPMDYPAWCWRKDSNLRPADYRSAALPTELLRQMVIPAGFEPGIAALKGL